MLVIVSVGDNITLVRIRWTQSSFPFSKDEESSAMQIASTINSLWNKMVRGGAGK
jgi:hypothetical protein